MKGFLTFLLLVAAGYGAYTWWSGRVTFGVNSSNPLGSYGDVEGHLTSKGLRPSKIAVSELEDLFDSKITGRSDLQATRFKESSGGVVTVIRARSGVMLAVGAQFRSDQKKPPPQGSQCELFFHAFWTDVTGALPAFTQPGGDEYEAQRMLVARDQAGRVSCTWKKNLDEGRKRVRDKGVLVVAKSMIRNQARPSGTGD